MDGWAVGKVSTPFFPTKIFLQLFSSLKFGIFFPTKIYLNFFFLLQIWECHPYIPIIFSNLGMSSKFHFSFPELFFFKKFLPFFSSFKFFFSKKFPSHSRSQIFPLDALWTLVGWPKLTPGDPGVTWCDPGWPKVGLKVTQGWLYFSLFFSILILSPFFPVLLHFSVFSCLPHVSPISSFFTHFDCVPM